TLPAASNDLSRWVDTLAANDTADRVERFDYDDAGRVTRKTSPTGAVCDYTYDGTGNLVAQVEYTKVAGYALGDEGNRITRHVYDSAGRLQYTVAPEGAA